MLQAALVIPTLDVCKAANVAQKAIEIAGSIEIATVIVCDHERRGGVITGNAALKGALRLGFPYIAYLNDDAEPRQQNWLMQLIEALNKNPRFGIAAPSGPCRIKPQNTVGPGAPYGVVEVSRPLSWFCAVIRLEVLQDVGLFDPNFIHYGDESDFHQRAKRQGWKSIWVRHVYVHHELGPVDIAWKAHDVKYYRSKWATRT